MIPVRARPDCRSPEPAGICSRRKMGEVPRGGSARDPGPEFLYSVLGQHRVHAPSVIRTAGGSATDGNSASDGSRQCASRVRPHSSEGLRRSMKPQDMKLLPTRSSLSTRSWASRMSQTSQRIGMPDLSRNWRLPSKVFSNQWRWMNPQKNLLGCPTRKPLMCWGRTRDLAPRSQPQKTGSLIHLADSPELLGTEDQSPDPWPAPLADGLWDAPQRDRC